MRGIFSMDNKFFVFMGRLADLFILNIITLICCIPIITIGASLTACHYMTLKMVRNEESYIIKGFFKSFKENFKQSTIINLILLVAAVLLFVDMQLTGANVDLLPYKVLYTIFIALMILYLMVFVYIYPVQAKFYNSIRNTFRNSMLMAVRHLPYTILMMVITVIPFAVVMVKSTYQVLSFVLMTMTLVGISGISYINDIFMRKIFDQYIPEEVEEEPEDTYAAERGYYAVPTPIPGENEETEKTAEE